MEEGRRVAEESREVDLGSILNKVAPFEQV
jgi:hypothetical protein